MTQEPARIADWGPRVDKAEDLAAKPRAGSRKPQAFGPPDQQGLYDPRHEHEACGVGFVVDMQGRKSHDLVEKGLQILLNLEHRGACGCEKNTGDGAGILLQTPHRFLARECRRLGITLPEAGDYGVAMIFLPTDEADRRQCEAIFEQVVREEGQTVLGWRTVPAVGSSLGPAARAAKPVVRQLFIGQCPPSPPTPHPRGERGGNLSPLAPVARGVGGEGEDPLAFERKLYVIRRRVENAIT